MSYLLFERCDALVCKEKKEAKGLGGLLFFTQTIFNVWNVYSLLYETGAV